MSWPYGTIGPRGCLLLLDSRLSSIEFVRGRPHARSPRPPAPCARQVGHLQNTPPYWIADLPPSYAVATATSMAPDCQLPPPYSAVADVHAPLRVYSDLNKPESAYIGGVLAGGGGGAAARTAIVETQAPATLAAAAECARYVDAARAPHPRMLPRSSTLDPERSSPCGEQYSTATMTNDQGIFTKIKESSLSISLTAALILVASIVVIISSITIQSAYMWLAVGATAVLFLGFCSCTTCEKTSHFHFRRGSIHSDSVSTISDGRDNFYEVGHLQNTPPYWIADLPPSYAVATATSMAPDCQLPPPYSAVADVHAPLRVYSDLNKPESAYIGAPPPPPPLASPAPVHAPAPVAVDAAVAVDCDSAGSPLHVPSSDARPPTNNRSVGTHTAASVGTDTLHPAGCCCDACSSPC